MVSIPVSMRMLIVTLLVVCFACAKNGQPTANENNSAIRPCTFVKSSQTFPPAQTNQIGLGDFDRDGDLDAVFSNQGYNNSTIWLNDGRGNFTNSGQQLTPQGHGVGIGDLDKDGDLDLFIACAGYGQLNNESFKPSKIYFNNGSGQFQDSGQDLGDKDLSGNGIALIDIDNDGDLDAQVYYLNTTLMKFFHKIYVNDGRGIFKESAIAFPLGSELAWADLDKDGDVDVFMREWGIGFSTLLNDGAGKFTTKWNTALSTVTDGSAGFGDFDKDGDLDVLVTNGSVSTANAPMLFLNDGTANLSNSGQQFGNLGAAWIHIGDLNKDNFPDALITVFNSPNRVWLNDGTGKLTDSGLSLGGNVPNCRSALGDLDGDGDLDAFVSYYGNGSNSIWINQ